MVGYPVPHHHRERERDERRYSLPHGPNAVLPPAASEDLHAWSIYRLVPNLANEKKQIQHRLMN